MRRRAPLLALGRRAFAERPYADVAVEDIAERAGASRTLIYHYFPKSFRSK
jgi:AcrR family transcriptional regulator